MTSKPDARDELRKYVDVSEINVGEEYYFVDTHFRYGVEAPTIRKEPIYRIVDRDFSTKMPDSRYEVIRHMPYRTYEHATARAIDDLEQYRASMNKAIDERISELAKQDHKEDV